MDLVNSNFPEAAKGNALVVFEAQDGATLEDDQAAVTTVLEKVGGLDHVASLTDPFDAGTTSEDGRIGYSVMTLDVPEREMGKPAFATLSEGVTGIGADPSTSSVRVELGGDAVSSTPAVAAPATSASAFSSRSSSSSSCSAPSLPRSCPSASPSSRSAPPSAASPSWPGS